MYERFEQLLKERNVKAADVAKATGIAQSSFTDWKKGRSKPKTEKLQLIADYFDVPLETFTGRKKRIRAVFNKNGSGEEVVTAPKINPTDLFSRPSQNQAGNTVPVRVRPPADSPQNDVNTLVSGVFLCPEIRRGVVVKIYISGHSCTCNVANDVANLLQASSLGKVSSGQ